MTSSLSIAEGTYLFVLDDAGVLFCETSQELHLFNTPATWVWCANEAGFEDVEIARQYSHRFKVALEDATRFVQRLLEEWRAAGYLAGADGEIRATRARTVRPASRGISIQSAPIDLPLHRLKAPARWASERTYRILTTVFTLRCQTSEQAQRTTPILSHFETDDAQDPDVVLEIRSHETGHVLFEDQTPVAACPTLEAVAPMLKGDLWRIVVNRHRYFMQIHAGVIAIDSGCVLIPGAPGAGKSTLTAALAASGFTYFSDESALLEPTTLEVRPFPIAMALKPGSIDLLEPYYPEVVDLDEHARGDGKRVRYLAPPRTSLAEDPNTARPVVAVIFPRVDVEAATTLVPLDRPTALGLLMDQCLVLPEDLEAASIARLVAWFRAISCYEFTIGNLADAVAEFGSFARTS